MLVAERRARIVASLKARGSVRVAELSRTFGVTEETIRRDLEHLEKQKLLERTYGGAVQVTGTGFELPFARRRETNIGSKAKIAKAAAALIEPGDTISLDASTTVLRLCAEMQQENLTVLTNSIQVLVELAGRASLSLIGTGGALRETSLSFVGPIAERVIEDHHVDKTFISCKGVSVAKGITDSNDLEVELKKRMVEAARRVVLLADHTKFGYVGFSRIAPIERIDVLITDDRVAADDLEPYREAGVQVVVADD